MAETPAVITSETTIIDVISQYCKTEKIFKGLEEETGTCVCCQGLFLSIGEAAEQFDFNLECVLADINTVINDKKK